MSADPKKRAPAKLGDVLASVLQQAGLTDRVAQAAVIPEWPTLVGAQIATVTEPLLLQQDGTLVVMVKTHAWMQELTFLEPELLRSLNRDPSRPPVTRLRSASCTWTTRFARARSSFSPRRAAVISVTTTLRVAPSGPRSASGRNEIWAGILVPSAAVSWT